MAARATLVAVRARFEDAIADVEVAFASQPLFFSAIMCGPHTDPKLGQARIWAFVRFRDPIADVDLAAAVKDAVDVAGSVLRQGRPPLRILPALEEALVLVQHRGDTLLRLLAQP